jgi:hypothetical protein
MSGGRFRKNPSYGGTKPPKKRAVSRVVSDYKEPLRRLRSIGINLYPEVSLASIRTPDDLTPRQRKFITRTYSNYDYLFSRPHVVADFSLPERKIVDEYSAWEKDVALSLRKEKFTPSEIKQAIRDAGGYEEFKRQRVKQNDAQKIAAQDFAGHHILDKNLTAAVIPVVTGMPNKVRLKYDKHGNVYVQEGAVTMHNVKIDPEALARGKGKYLEKLLSGFKDTDRFMLVTGDYMTLANSGYKGNIIKKMLRHMERYSAKMLKGGKGNEHHWKNWMLGLRVMRGNPYHTEALRSAHDVLRRRMKAEKKAAYDAAEALQKGHEQAQDTALKQRKRKR